MRRLLALALVPLLAACGGGGGGAAPKAQATAGAIATSGAGTVQAVAPTVQAAGATAAAGANTVATSVAATVQAVLPTAQAAPKSATPVASPAAKAASPVAPGASPSPSPRAAGGLKIVSAVVQDTQFGPRLTGFIENQGREPFSQIQVKASLIDEAEQILDSKTGIYMRDLVPVGERSPFLVPFPKQPKDWKKERVEAEAQAFDARSLATSGLAQGLTAEDVTLIPPENQFSGYKVTGKIKNDGNTTVTNAVAIVALYDADGEAIDVNQVSGEPQQIPAGQSTSFTMDFPFTNIGVVKHEVWVQGRIQR